MQDQDAHLDQRFEEQWRAWATRPPQRTPAQAAQRFRALVRSGQHRRQTWWLGRWAVAGALTTMLLAITIVSLWSQRSAVSIPNPTQASLMAAPALGNGQVLIWLDEETPLYMTFQMPDEVAESGGS